MKQQINQPLFLCIIGFQLFGNITQITYELDPVFAIIIIHSKEVTDEFRRHFEFLWKHAKK